jgi:hypothetical protein
MSISEPTPTPYGDAYDILHDLGWPVLWLPPAAKLPPPEGFTGYDGIDASYADLTAWADRPDGNVAVRMLDYTVGVDVDNYDGKPGAATLAECEAKWGALPNAFMTSSRDDGISGIRWCRVPPGTRLIHALPGIELVQRHHRYIVAPGSIHPEGRVYRGHYDGEPHGGVCKTCDTPPRPDQLPELPQAWLDGLRAPERIAPADVDAAEAGGIVAQARTAGQPDVTVEALLRDALNNLKAGAA